MQIDHFHCSGLNAFLNYDFDFFSDVTFLHGINGSGKTSILRAVASLLTPDPVWMLSSTFDEISVSLEHHGQRYLVSAKGGGQPNLTVTISGAIELTDSVSRDDLLPLLKTPDEDFYRLPASVQEEVNVRTKRVTETYKTFAFLANLPTPDFLGLR